MIDFIRDMEEEAGIEFWIVFDHDEKNASVEKAYRLVAESDAVPGRPKIQIALNIPCIEAWALLHFVEPGKVPVDRHKCQGLLEQSMPPYNHDSNPVFNVPKMFEDGRFEKAKQSAADWKRSCAGRDEFEAAKLAGIYRLVASILDA
jgi:hypothetical protein